MKSLVFALALILQVASATKSVSPPRDIEQLVKPILDLVAEGEASKGELQNAAFYRAAKLTGALFTAKTKAADEALVVLMSFYIGESTGGDLLHQVTVRGKRMLPLLVKYRNAQVIISGRKYPPSTFLPTEIRREDFDEAIKCIQAGKVLGQD
ncbi:MAG: hypothetical protein WA261_20770 [Candidatus Sulfotelmatobacter sp.]|jgi:hypothetical protein